MLKRVVLFLLGLVSGLLAVLMLFPTKLKPVAWHPQPAPELTGVWSPNSRLNSAILEQSGLSGPDTVVVDQNNQRYSAIADGRIVSWQPDTELSTYANISGRPVGLNFDHQGNLFAADEQLGVIWKVDQKRTVTKLAQSFNGRPFNLLNDVWPASDGRVFFTESSKRWPLSDNQLALIEHGGDGAVFVRHIDGRVEQLLGDLNFANGVVLSANEEFLLVAETGAYQITRLWLLGDRAGQREVLVDNLPGFPGDLSLAPDGQSFWCSLFTPRKALLDQLAPYPSIRKLLGYLPNSWLPKAKPFPFVFRFNANGEILETLQASDDTDASNALPSFSSVVQVGNDLLLGTPGGVGSIDSNRVYRVSLDSR